MRLTNFYSAQKHTPGQSDTLKISVIVPTLNEASILEDSLRAISGLNPHEIIVADDGSDESTRIFKGISCFSIPYCCR